MCLILVAWRVHADYPLVLAANYDLACTLVVVALMALAATSDVYSDDDCAAKILPGVCPSLIDKEK